MDHYPPWAALSVRRLLRKGSRAEDSPSQICSLVLKMLAAKFVLPSLETDGTKQFFFLFLLNLVPVEGKCHIGIVGTARQPCPAG